MGGGGGGPGDGFCIKDRKFLFSWSDVKIILEIFTLFNKRDRQNISLDVCVSYKMDVCGGIIKTVLFSISP